MKKNVAQKINVILFFDIEFFKYFFLVLHEASSSWLKFLHAFQKHPVDINCQFCEKFALIISRWHKNSLKN
jgi:hypothetical protein